MGGGGGEQEGGRGKVGREGGGEHSGKDSNYRVRYTCVCRVNCLYHFQHAREVIRARNT